MKRLVVLGAATLGLGGLATAVAVTAGVQPARVSATVATVPVKSITWGACPPDVTNYGQASLQCGTLQVPEDYANPDGPKITLEVSRLPHIGTGRRQGVILVNPGGPGDSGTGFAARVGGAGSAAMRESYDFIGFDPRGVGNSSPSVSCDPDYVAGPRPDYYPSAGTEATWQRHTKAYAVACGQKYGHFLDHVKTTDSARDMDSIRRALGEEQINYYGASYGTYLGAVYVTLFPKQVRRMLLDGVVRPSGVWYDDNLKQDVTFDDNLGHFFAWLAKYDAKYHLGKTPEAVRDWYYETRAKLGERPLGGKVGPDELDDYMQGAAYRNLGRYWFPTADDLAAYKAGNPTPLTKHAAAGPGDNRYAMYLAVQCTDVQWPTDWAKWQQDNGVLARKYPFITWGNAWYNAPCINWQGKVGSPVRIGATKDLPKNILLMEARYDAATPYEGALEMQRLLKGSHLVIEDNGRTHVIAHRGNPRVDAYYEYYFLSGALPATRQAHVPTLGDPTPPAATPARPTPEPTPATPEPEATP